jgi:hypothetical protein
MRKRLPLAAVCAPRLNGALIPSIADEVATDLVTVFSLTAGLRRYGFAEESFALTCVVYSRFAERP